MQHSTVLRSGTLKNCNVTFFKKKTFIWTSGSVKTLGVNFHNDSTANLTNNLEPKIEEFNNCLKQWQHRKLTLMGKITVVKTFALPKLVYPFTVLENPVVENLDEIKKVSVNLFGTANLIKSKEVC